MKLSEQELIEILRNEIHGQFQGKVYTDAPGTAKTIGTIVASALMRLAMNGYDLPLPMRADTDVEVRRLITLEYEVVLSWPS